MGWEIAGAGVGRGLPGTPFVWSQERLWTETPGGQVASLSRVSAGQSGNTFLRNAENLQGDWMLGGPVPGLFAGVCVSLASVGWARPRSVLCC